MHAVPGAFPSFCATLTATTNQDAAFAAMRHLEQTAMAGATLGVLGSAAEAGTEAVAQPGCHINPHFSS